MRLTDLTDLLNVGYKRETQQGLLMQQLMVKDLARDVPQS